MAPRSTQGWEWGGWEQPAADGQFRYATLLPALFQGQVNIALPTSTPAPPDPETRQRLLAMLANWSFNPLSLSPVETYHCACLIFEAVLTLPGLSTVVAFGDIRRFLHTIRSLYPQNPYHNFQHAVDVLQATYSFLAPVVPPLSEGSFHSGVTYEAQLPDSHPLKTLRPLDVLALLLAAVGHDTAHPGLTAVFLANARSPLTEMMPSSPLETLHYTLLYQALRSHNLTAVLSDSESESLMRNVVLATDMSLHKSYMDKFETAFRDLRPTGEPLKILVCQALLKAADISNPTRPLPVSVVWSSSLVIEWSNQAILEESYNLPKTQIVAAEAGTAEYNLAQAKGQIGFMTACTVPIFEVVALILPNMETYVSSCYENKRAWQQRLDSLVASTAA